jgi:hypothetical protein
LTIIFLPNCSIKNNLRYTGMSQADIFAANVASAVDAAEGKAKSSDTLIILIVFVFIHFNVLLTYS